jgi:hypothetical protein
MQVLHHIPTQEDFPTLEVVLSWAQSLQPDTIVGYANDCQDCPFSNCLTALLGDDWIVSQDVLIFLYRDGQHHLREHHLPTPLVYRKIISVIDDPNYREGDPKRSIPALAFSEMLQAHLTTA